MTCTCMQSECQIIWIRDEVKRFVGTHLDPNCLQRLSLLLKNSPPSRYKFKIGWNISSCMNTEFKVGSMYSR